MALKASYNEARKGLWFSLDIATDEFLAFISADALKIHFSASEQKRSLMEAYRQNQAVIRSVATGKFHSGAQRPIKLSVCDF